VLLRAREISSGDIHAHEFEVVAPSAEDAERLVRELWPGGADWAIEIQVAESAQLPPRDDS
jgi:hypothetical protein